MIKKNLLLMISALCFGLCCCKNQYANIKPAIVPDVQKKQEEKKPQVDSVKIIGAVEPIYILPIKAPFYARVDTGAETSSLDAQNIKLFERDGKRWVSFDIVHNLTKEKAHFEKRIRRRVAVRRINEFEHRKKVEMKVKFGGETFNAYFSLADRSEFDYQALIGRNILMGRAAVDVSVSNTLR